jgi:hypothetical protein
VTLPGWVGVREPRGRLGGRYAKNVTICPTQGDCKPSLLRRVSTVACPRLVGPHTTFSVCLSATPRSVVVLRALRKLLLPLPPKGCPLVISLLVTTEHGQPTDSLSVVVVVVVARLRYEHSISLPRNAPSGGGTCASSRSRPSRGTSTRRCRRSSSSRSSSSPPTSAEPPRPLPTRRQHFPKREQ